MTPASFKAAIAQYPCGQNLAPPSEWIDTAAQQAADMGAKLLVLPELHNSIYFCQQQWTSNFDFAETIPGPSTEFLSAIAKRHNLVIVASLFEKRSSGLYHNTAVVMENDGTMAGYYRKMHIPDDPGYNEKYYFAPGEANLTPIECSLGKLGIQVCWDQWYPEAARLLALAGAELLIYPTAIGWELSDPETLQQQQLQAWMTIQRAHAIANGIPVISCNRVGFEAATMDVGDNHMLGDGAQAGIQFWGNSFIYGSFGEELLRLPANESVVAVAEIDKTQTTRTRRLWPFLRDRRIDAYQDIVKRFR